MRWRDGSRVGRAVPGGEEVALPEAAADPFEFGKLSVGLDAFGDGVQPEGVGELETGADEGGTLEAAFDPFDERSRNLENVEGERAQ